MVTINDVARRAGVSTMTVSRALRDSPLVATCTKSRILQVVEELGYVPNLLARSLVQKRSPILGLVITELANPFFTPIITAIQEGARSHDYFVMIGDSERDISNQERYLNQFQQIQIAGLLITPVMPDTEMLEAIRDGGTPVVVIARRWEKGDYVSADNVAGGRMVAEHLLSLGHRRFSCICLREPGHTALADRIFGFRQTLQEAGFPFTENQILHTDSLRVEDGAKMADAFLELSPRPSSVFVVADRLAVGFVDRLLERGIKVPEDVAVVGYDDIRYSAYLKVPLTTVALPKAEIGCYAMNILLERLNISLDRPTGNREWRQVLLQPELIIRAST
jgi:LacI family transcriptional regulator